MWGAVHRDETLPVVSLEKLPKRHERVVYPTLFQFTNIFGCYSDPARMGLGGNGPGLAGNHISGCLGTIEADSREMSIDPWNPPRKSPCGLEETSAFSAVAKGHTA